MVKTGKSITRKLTAALLALVMLVGMLPGAALAAETDLPDWYFLFVIIKNVDADCTKADGTTVHTSYSMTQDEIDIARDNAKAFGAYMNNVGVMRAHVDVIETDTPVTELKAASLGSFVDAAQAVPVLESAGVDLDRYDHVISVVSLNVSLGYFGMTGAPFDNGTGHSCITLTNREYALKTFVPWTADYPMGSFVHEFLHFMADLNGRYGPSFDLHGIRENFYEPTKDDYKNCYTDIILNRVKGDAETGTGISPAVWQYPPRVFRTIRDFTVPDGVTGIGESAFYRCNNLESVIIPTV